MGNDRKANPGQDSQTGTIPSMIRKHAFTQHKIYSFKKTQKPLAQLLIFISLKAQTRIYPIYSLRDHTQIISIYRVASSLLRVISSFDMHSPRHWMRSRFDMKSHSTLRHKTHHFLVAVPRHSFSVVVAVEGHNNSDSHNTKT